MSQKLCTKGSACEYHKLGKCKFVHSSTGKTVKSSKSNSVRHKAGSPISDKFEGMRKLIASAHTNLMARKALNAELKSSMGSYFDVKDKKDVAAVPELYTRQLKLLDDELLALRAVAKGMWGSKTFKLTVFYQWQLSITVTSGLVSGSQTLDPSSQTEWIAAASLFDEYKVPSAVVHYRVKTAVNYSSVEQPFGVIAYDPTTSSGLASAEAGLVLAQHQLVPIPSTYEAIANTAHRTFHVEVPKGIQETNFALGIGNWLMVNAPLPYGYLKFYCIGDNKTAVTNGGFGAFTECHNEFRIRE
jgi:hypothetical protein